VTQSYSVHIYLTKNGGLENVIRTQDDRVEPEIIREVLGEPVLVPDVVRILGKQAHRSASQPQSTYSDRDEAGDVYLSSQLERTLQLYT
jgi:hypothetical protein